jgi:hypothetical protein
MMPVIMFTSFLDAGTANGSALTTVIGERHKESVNHGLYASGILAIQNFFIV